MIPFVLDETIDRSKFDRQVQIIRTWINNGRIGTLVGITGFGKTFTGILGIRNTIKMFGEIDVTIVVPNLFLKDQWEGLLEAQEIDATVLVINSAIKDNTTTTLLVLDEIHRYTAEEFGTVYDCIDHQYVFGLTGTLDSDDPRMSVINTHCPIIDRVDYDEALANNWISDWITYCLPVQISQKDIEIYEKVDKSFKYFFSKLNYDFDLMFQACNPEGAEDFAHRIGQPVGKVVGWANQARINMSRRKEVIMNSSAKLDVAKQIISTYSSQKMIVFTEYTDAADSMAEPFDFAESYHSSLPTKLYKDGTYIGKKVGKNKYQTTKGILSWNVVKKVHGKVERISGDRQCDRIQKAFKSGDITALMTAKKVDEGADFPEVGFSLIHSAPSSNRQDVQRRGRTIRVMEGKLAINIQIYIPDTQDEKWLNKRLKGVPNVRYVETIDDLYKSINYNLKLNV